MIFYKIVGCIVKFAECVKRMKSEISVQLLYNRLYSNRFFKIHIPKHENSKNQYQKLEFFEKCT